MALQKGELVLISGVNGYIASHIADECLKAGLRVRGTVRAMAKAHWMPELFNKRYGDGKFEVVEVTEMEKDGAFDTAIQGCQGIVHTASIVSFSPDPNQVIPQTIAGATNILKAAARTPSVRRVVYTSSSTAATFPKPNAKFHFDNTTWNKEASAIAWAPPPFTAERAFPVYGASKSEAEQACWEFMRTEKPQFVLTTVLPNYNTGTIMHPDQPASTAGWIKGVWNNQKQHIDTLSSFPPQYYINVDDNAKLHVAGLIYDDVEGERLMAFAGPFTFNEVLAVMRKIDPERALPEPLKDEAVDLSTVPTDRELEILKRFGHSGWTDFETCIRQNVGVA